MSVWAEQFDRALGMLVRDLERPYEGSLDIELARRIRYLGLTLEMYGLLDKLDRLAEAAPNKRAAEPADDGGGTIAPHGECAYCDRRRASNSDGARRRRRGEVV